MPLLFTQFPAWLKPEIIPGLPIRWYGLMYIVAFGVAYFLTQRQVKEKNGTLNKEIKDELSNFFFWSIIGLILGARLFSALIYDTSGEFLRAPWLIFWPFRGGRFVGLQGMSYHGGVVGAAVAAFIYMKVKKIYFWERADLVAAAIPLGYTFGRLGNFINGELYGRVTTAPWGMIFPHAPQFSTAEQWVQDFAANIQMNITGMTMVNLPRHPSQLYEAIFEGLVLWAVLWFIIRKKKPFHGTVLASYLMGYGIVRFFIEYFREPDAGLDFPITFASGNFSNYLLESMWNFTTGQILCFIMILSGIGVLFLARFYHKKKEAEEQASEAKKPKVNYRKLRKKIK